MGRYKLQKFVTCTQGQNQRKSNLYVLIADWKQNLITNGFNAWHCFLYWFFLGHKILWTSSFVVVGKTCSKLFEDFLGLILYNHLAQEIWKLTYLERFGLTINSEYYFIWNIFTIYYLTLKVNKINQVSRNQLRNTANGCQILNFCRQHLKG